MLEVVGALLEFLQGLLDVVGALDDRAHLGGTNVTQDGLELVGGGSILGDVELKLLALGVSLVGVVAGLVLGSRLGGIGVHLLQEGSHAHRTRRLGLVEDGDDVLGLVLELGYEHSWVGILRGAPPRGIEAWNLRSGTFWRLENLRRATDD